jgi:hypothetical protein
MGITKSSHCFNRIKCLVLLTLIVSGQAFGFGLAISPTTVEMVVKPGSQHRQTITVQNVHKKKTLALTVGVADWVMSENGELELLPPGTEEESVTDWVRFSPAFFSLKPGEVRQIQVDLAVPIKINNAGERRMGIIISTLLPSNDQRPEVSGVWNRYQITSLFYVALPGANHKPATVTAVTLQDKASVVPVVNFTVENSGDYHARLKGRLALLNKQGKQVFKVPVEGVLMANQTRQFKLPVKLDDSGLPGGEYKLELKLENSFTMDENSTHQAVLIKADLPTISVANPVVSLK